MKSKNLIIMIIFVLVLFCGQLAAEEIVGESIFPCIETPHPYPVVSSNGNYHPVWSEVIQMPGATWLKIHFSQFHLNEEDYVELLDTEGRLVERIRGKDVVDNKDSIFKVKKNDKKGVDFWGPAVDGESLTIQLYRRINKETGWGFTIDEIGVGCKPIFDKGLGPVYNKVGEVLEKGRQPFVPDNVNNLKNITHSRSMSIKVFSTTSGIMLYRKGLTWFTGDGFLTEGSYNEFVLEEPCIDGPEIVDTLEVRFYLDYMVNGSISTVHYNYYCENFFKDYFSDDFGILTLKYYLGELIINADGTSSQYFTNMDTNTNMNLSSTFAHDCSYGCNGILMTIHSGPLPECNTFQCNPGDPIQCCCH